MPAHIEHLWQRNEILVRTYEKAPNGDRVYVIAVNEDGTETFYQHNPHSGQKPDKDPIAYRMTEDTARELMEALQRHFGAYAGVDYDRLRKDYDRQAAEADKANEFVRETLKTILEGKKTAAPKAPAAP